MEHLVDRAEELQILRRLARKHIGPRLLGTFKNGRFEEYLHAHTLTPDDIRKPDFSKQIAKRMRELHDGIELLREEGNAGPGVWKNWDRWVGRAGQMASWCDRQILSGPQSCNRQFFRIWKNRGFVCGVEWPIFRRAVEASRRWLIERYHGMERIKSQLVFSHNDVGDYRLFSLLAAYDDSSR